MSVQNVNGAYYSTYCSAISPAQNRQAYRAGIPTENQDTTQGDQVSISQRGRLLSALPPLFSEEIEADGMITLDEIRQFLQEKSADLADELRTRLSTMGVDISEPLDLDVAADGSIVVKGDHPQKAEIEAMFAADPELSNRVRQVSSTAGFLKAAEEYAEFAAEYDKDPEAAVAKYAHLFSAVQPSYFLRFDGEGISVMEEGSA